VEAAAPGGGPVTLVGESFGGALAMSYALAHPGRAGRLVILNSFACIESRSGLWLAHQLLRATPWSVMPLVRHLNARRMYSPQTGRAEIRVTNDLLRASTRQGYMSRLGMLRDYDLRLRLPDDAPAYAARGEVLAERAVILHAQLVRGGLRPVAQIGGGEACARGQGGAFEEGGHLGVVSAKVDRHPAVRDESGRRVDAHAVGRQPMLEQRRGVAKEQRVRSGASSG
jgi:pimeloyl-ACP methyl ester carboxylesterase